MKRTLYSYIIITLISVQNIFAGGFQINEHGARPMAMGGAFTGLANDPSALYFNGAGIAFLYGTNFLAGTTLIAPSSSFRGVFPSIDESSLESAIFHPVHFFATHNFGNDFSAGLGFTSPFGLGTTWDENWIGRYLAINTQLQIFTVTPTVSYKVMDNLAVSAAFVYSFANVELSRKSSLAPFAGDAFVTLEGDETGAYGYQFGLMYKPFEGLSLGASFHSEIDYSFEGTAVSEGPSQVSASLPSGDITAEITTPMNLAVGAAYTFDDRSALGGLTLTADYQYVGWSSYDSLKVNFVNEAFEDIASARLYDNSYVLRFGAEYKVNNDLAVQGGVYFDNNPVSDAYVNPSLPEADRLGLSAGLSYKFTKNLGVQASYLFIRGKQLTVSDSEENYSSVGEAPFNGTYNSSAHLVSLSISYSL